MTKNDTLIPLFNTLKNILSEYEEHFTVRKSEEGYYDLWSEKEIILNNKKRKEIFFAGLIIQKHYVGFYFMPIYADDSLKEFFGPELLKTLKGKSCFYIKNDDPIILGQIRGALKRGLELYRERDWL